MPHDGLPARVEPGSEARVGAREAAADRVAAARVTTTRFPSTSRRIAALGAVTVAVLVAACGSTSSSGSAGATGAPPASASSGASASAEASASASAGLNKGFLVFQEQNASKVFGGGTLIDLGDGSVAVSLGVVAIGYDDPMPARLVSGACTDAASAPAPSFEPVPSAGASAGASAAASSAPSVAASAAASAGESTAPSPATLPVDLTPVNGGSSSTVVQIQLGDLLSSPSSVLLYKSAAAPTLVACADVTAELTLPSGAPTASGATGSTAPSLPAASGSTAP